MDKNENYVEKMKKMIWLKARDQDKNLRSAVSFCKDDFESVESKENLLTPI